MDDTFYLKELKPYLDNEKRVKAYPAKRRAKLIVLFYLASKFEYGREYTEKEVNEVLKQWHTFGDWAILRRELYDKMFFARKKDGSLYSLEEEQPTLASFDLQ